MNYTEPIDAIIEWGEANPNPTFIQREIVADIWSQYQAYEHEHDKNIVKCIVELGVIALNGNYESSEAWLRIDRETV